MNSKITTLKQNIEHTLKDFDNQPLREAATTFLNTLSYYSKRIGNDEIDNERFNRLVESALNSANPSDKLRIDEWQSFLQIMQVADEEINQQKTPDQGTLFESSGIDDMLRTSYMFVTVQLTNNTYTRTQLADITRFINKVYEKPIMVLFRYGVFLTLAIINRRHHKRAPNKQVLEKVTLIKDVNLDSPKRAHIDILSELELHRLIENEDVRNFDTLHKAWEGILNTEALNKRFYRELEAWYEWAAKICKFPDGENKTQVVRMITRLLFIWFLKEKDLLVPSDLFDEGEAQKHLKYYDPETSDYYQAILQNLFFATLNTPINERIFSTRDNRTHRDASKYRYADLLQNPIAFLEHLKQVPFVNGGLFDSLDSFKGKRAGGVRIDCFTDDEIDRGKLHVPAKLFFEKDNGIFEIFSHYKFTVEENTPVDQEVALDPELLGQVFENLLGVYNPESEAAARKTTGSYYTPRQIVDYMVDEALIAYFLQKVEPYDNDKAYLADRIRDDLLAYDQQGRIDNRNDHLIDENEIEPMIAAIDELKILDPAAGSGAFPMGILNKLVLILKKLDPENDHWKRQQIKQAENIPDPQSREASVSVIEAVFSEANQYNNYGRKLYLIQNCIYGVDIQPIAVTIAKLRFFISLVIEQHPNDNPNQNYGIRPLPNLETKFVAANTLIGLNELRQDDLQLLLENDRIRQLREEIEDICVKYFSESDRQVKLEYIDDEDRCREQLAEALATQHTEWCEREQNKISEQVAQIPTEKAQKQLREKLQKAYKVREAKLTAGVAEAQRIANWKRYNQNEKADFFDPEWMFGITAGFDVVIGNPPYVESRNSLLTDEQKVAYGKQVVSDWKESLPRGSDLLIYFFARAPKFLNESGNGCFITQNAWLNTDYGHKFQQFSLNKFSFLKIIDSSSKFFSDSESQNINTIITLFTRELIENIKYGIVDANLIVTDKKVIKSSQSMKWGHIFSMPEFYREILAKITSKQKRNIRDKISFGQGLNFPLSQLSNDNSDLPVIVKSAQFVAISVDKRIRPALAKKRMEKIPALVMPRGIGARHYCAFNSCRAFSYSHVELYLPEDLWNSDMHYCLWIYFNSSFVWLFREITGRKNLGGGLLKAEVTDMKVLPIGFNFDFDQEAKQVFNVLKDREPLPVAKEIQTDEHLLIDDIVADYLGFQNRLEDIKSALVEQVNFRLTRAKSSK